MPIRHTGRFSVARSQPSSNAEKEWPSSYRRGAACLMGGASRHSQAHASTPPGVQGVASLYGGDSGGLWRCEASAVRGVQREMLTRLLTQNEEMPAAARHGDRLVTCGRQRGPESGVFCCFAGTGSAGRKSQNPGSDPTRGTRKRPPDGRGKGGGLYLRLPSRDPYGERRKN